MTMPPRIPSILFALLLGAGAASAADPASSPELQQARSDLKAAWQKTQAAQENLARVESGLGMDTPAALAWEFVNDPKRGALGLVFARGGKGSALPVQGVSPGGAADRAGLRDGDVLLAIDKTSFAGLSNDEALATLHKLTRTLHVGDRLQVQYQRSGTTAQATLVADRPKFLGRHLFGHDEAGNDEPGRGPPHDLLTPGFGQRLHDGMPMPSMHLGEPSPDVPLQLVTLSPELAPYFKVTAGVLVLNVKSDDDAPSLGLKPGDVIQQVDGQPVASPLQVFEQLLHGAGTTVKLAGIRAGAPLSLDAAVPTREAIEARMRKHHPQGPPFAVE